jgi:hypothetical protein
MQQTVTLGQTYYIRVQQYSSYTGNFRIGFSKGPSIVWPPASSTLYENVWTDGAGAEQWFKFDATATYQYIHFVFGTAANDTNIQLFAEDGTSGASAVVNPSYNEYYATLSVATGTTYYMRVRSNNSGTYQIAFNTDYIPPPVTLPYDATYLYGESWSESIYLSAGDEWWFTFDATAFTQYIYGDGPGRMYVQVYASSGDVVGENRSTLSMWGGSAYTERPVTQYETYYIRVRPLNDGYFRVAVSEYPYL